MSGRPLSALTSHALLHAFARMRRSFSAKPSAQSRAKHTVGAPQMLWSQDQGNGEMVHGQRDGHSLASPTGSLSADASPEPPAQNLGQRLEGNLPSQVSSGAPSSVLGRPAGRAAAGWCQVSREEPEVSPARAHSHPSPAPPGTLCPAQARLSQEDRSVPSPQTSCPGRGSASIGAQPGLPGPFIPHQPSRKTPLSPRLWMGTAGPRVTVSEVPPGSRPPISFPIRSKLRV